MEKNLRSAILVHAGVLTGALLFLLAFLRFGLGHDSPLLNMALVLIGLVTVTLLLSVFWRQTLRRESMVRRFYISSEWIYNHEIGYAPLERIVPDGNVFDFVTFAADALAHMSYGFEVANPPTSFVPSFVIDSEVFLYHQSGNEQDDGVVVDEWQGVLCHVDDPTLGDRGFSIIDSFENAGELADLLARNGALDPSPGKEDAAQ